MEPSAALDAAPLPLLPEVTVFVHPCDPVAHPTYPPGTWRWAVMVGGAGPTQLERCAQAGGQRTEREAHDVGAMVGAAVVNALLTFGVPVGDGTVVHLDFDPIPAEADHLPLGVFHDDPQEG